MGVNSLPKTVTRQRRGCDLNPGPSAPESSTLTTRLPSHPTTHATPLRHTFNGILSSKLEKSTAIRSESVFARERTRTDGRTTGKHSAFSKIFGALSKDTYKDICKYFGMRPMDEQISAR